MTAVRGRLPRSRNGLRMLLVEFLKRQEFGDGRVAEVFATGKRPFTHELHGELCRDLRELSCITLTHTLPRITGKYRHWPGPGSLIG